MTTLSDDEFLDFVQLIEPFQLTNAYPVLDQRLQELITALPKLTETDVDLDANCPICLVPFRAHLAEEEMALAMESPTHAAEDLGVTRLQNTCKHTFCRKDITTWIRQQRKTCPTCRRPLHTLPDEPEDNTNQQTAPGVPSFNERRIARGLFDHLRVTLSGSNTTTSPAAPVRSSGDASAERRTSPAQLSPEELNAETHAGPALSVEDHHGALQVAPVAPAHPLEGQQPIRMPSTGDYRRLLLQAAGSVMTGDMSPAVIETLDRLVEAMVLYTPTAATVLQSDDTWSPNHEGQDNYPDRSEFEMYS